MATIFYTKKIGNDQQTLAAEMSGRSLKATGRSTRKFSNGGDFGADAAAVFGPREEEEEDCAGTTCLLIGT